MPIVADDIRSLLSKALDVDETDKIINRFRELRNTRNPLFLNNEDFELVLHWKLRDQYSRQERIRRQNTDTIIRLITQTAFSIVHDNVEFEIEFRIKLLCCLHGVGVPVASAILTLVFPERYGIIDFRNWRQIFDEERTSFDIRHYIRYWHRIMEISRELNWTPQQVDLAIWEYDRRNS